jgi:hypothetical protein
MTAVHPPRIRTGEDHLTAWAAGYLTSIPTSEEIGYQRALRHVAERAADHGLLNPHKPAARLTGEQWTQARIAQAEACAARINVAMGRHPLWQYRGGAVDWDSGLPQGSACAWLRRTRRKPDKRVAA